MTPEIETARRFLQAKIGEILAAVEGLDEADLNRAPNLPCANSPYVIATHVLGNMRAWVLGIACGNDLRRDRPAEFRSKGSYQDLESAARALSGKIDEALQSFDASRLDDGFVPTQELFGEGSLREVSRREALWHPVEHAGIHLGHIHLSVTLLRDRA
jgi:uncharacterized damage-inducible protein DinB